MIGKDKIKEFAKEFKELTMKMQRDNKYNFYSKIKIK